jgi:phosphoribosylformimino-5-aminoimidazole carboxamide ribotide isomerase
MRIIPAIDIIDGRCVRLTRGDYTTQKVYREDPVEVARELEAAGIRYLHVVDLDGARSSHIVNHASLRSITQQTGLSVDFGGGIKSEEDIRIAFDCGATQVTAGTVAARNPELFLTWVDEFGAERIILGADSMNRKIAANGWLEGSSHDVVDFIESYYRKGVKYVICTDISKDGMLEGASEDLYGEILRRSPVQLIASGGVAGLRDVENLRALGCEGVIIGKALYEGRITLEELSALC